ncbi:hypothetical protein Acr_03g0013590 [Actinidia rufa]|uniref:RNA-binding (RRM/RBD/RNP motifs) family protein n=1 Tax=Actinidia rufa TaxID=165716 RepID=A0A7J0EDR8_9ERIC|nr:hypothetical protein Acr_03g0013590 [Actinidia rufa]
MASSSSSSPSSSSSLSSSSSIVTITPEEFKAFHTIDRKVYARLVLGEGGRDPSESMRVVAFFLWLERNGYDRRLVKRMEGMPLHLVKSVAAETAMCLNSLESERFVFDPQGNDLPFLKSVLADSRINLKHFYDQRIAVLSGVARIVTDVCVRAFQDIVSQALTGHYSLPRPLAVAGGVRPSNSGGGGAALLRPVMVAGGLGGGGERRVPGLPFYTRPGVVPRVPGYGANYARPVGVSVSRRPAFWDGSVGGSNPNYNYQMVPVVSLEGFDPNYELERQRKVVNDELGEFLGRINIGGGEGSSSSGGGGEGEREVPHDDRTIFLTFSKGYPISESEVGEFFTRKFGDVFESIHMQEVVIPGEQPLYALLVARSASVIPVVLGGHTKARFSINGKHVWARKYVRKNPRAASPPPAPTSPPKP